MNEDFKLPPSLLKQLKQYADAQGLTADQFVMMSVAEKIARTEHQNWLLKNWERSRQKT